MKRWTIFLWFMVLAISPEAQTTPSDSISLKIMTFNIRYDNPDDGLFGWAYRKDLFFNLLKQEQPDVLGLQEALVNQVNEISNRLPSYTWFGVGRDDGMEAGEFAPIFYRKNHFIKIDSGFFWLSETPDVPGSVSWGAACTRIVTWLKLQEKTTEKVVCIFNTHFDHVSEDARVNAAKLLVSKMKQIAGEYDIILTGDLNCTPEDQAFKILSNALRVTGPDPEHLDRSCTFVGFPARFSPGHVIDFIFINAGSGMSASRYHISDFHLENFYPSDHLPVICDVEIYKSSPVK